MFKDPRTGQKLAFYGVFYILFAVMITVGWYTKDYIRPVAAMFVPINDKPFEYTFLVLTGMYWGCVIFFEMIFTKKK